MGGVYLTVLYLERLEKLRTRENWGVCTFCPTKKEFQMIFYPLTYWKKSPRAYSCFVVLANWKRDLGMHVAFAFFSNENKANRNLD